MSNSQYLLAVESAISGGSLALFQDDRLIASLSGGGSVSRAEDLLPNIASLLEEAMISKSDLRAVAVSLGPGSYTGLRIGISTVLGLSRALTIRALGVPLFAALSSDVVENHSVSVVPMGKSELCFSRSDHLGSARVGSIEELASEIDKAATIDLRCHTDVHHRLSERFRDRLMVIDIGRNLADYIGRASARQPQSPDFKPIYSQNPRFNSDNDHD